MKSSSIPRILVICCCLLAIASGLWAQQISGSISGTVKDAQGAVIPNAQVVLTDQDRGGQRRMNSNAEGSFMFDLLAPSSYTVSVEASGFKKWEKKDLKLYANDRLGVNDIVMQVGQVTDTVTVEATTAQLQTESAKIESSVTSQQFTELSVRDRNFMYLLKTIPGVSPDSLSSRVVNINGGRIDQTSFKLDGLVNNDYGDNGCCSVYSSMDIIAEMKVVTNGATADMGTLGASQVMVVTKSGSKEYHGSAYYYKRAEWLNANSWNNNYTIAQRCNGNVDGPTCKGNIPLGYGRGRDRQNQVGFTLGGPIQLPKSFNMKDKLFFFVNEELWKNSTPNTSRVWSPSALERTGDFSQSLNASDNNPVVPLDPLNKDATGKPLPFQGAVIPGNRIDKDMQKLMNIMPLPNTVRTANVGGFGTSWYNYSRMNSPSYNDRLSQSYRVDYNLNEKWRVYFRYTHDYTEIGDPLGMGSFEQDINGKTMGWNLQYRPSYSGLFNITTILSPTSTNELVVGTTRTQDHHYLDKIGYLNPTLGLSIKMPYPQANTLNLGPRVSITGSGTSSNPSLGSNLPFMAFSPDYNVTDNFTKIMTRHTIKAGIFFDFNRKDQDPWNGQAYAGNISINRELNTNPYDTDSAWANWITGAFSQFQQVPKHVEGRYLWKQFEWYVSDTWKAKPNLTVDAGIRFYVMQPQYDSKGQIAIFSPGLWDPSKTVQLYSRVLVNGKSQTVDPRNPSVVLPTYYAGQIVLGSGDINNGFALAGTRGVPRGMLPYQGILAAPRLGFSWQPKFLPKTVIRASGGVFYDRIQGNVISNSLGLPPTTRTQTLKFGMVSDISNPIATLVAPPGPLGGYIGSGKIPTTYTWNFAIQRELPQSVTFEAAYVGQASRHIIFGQPMNEAAFGSAWLPENQDPWKPTSQWAYNGTTTQPYDYYRPYRGISGMTAYESSGGSNYNSLQVRIDKKMSRKLSFGVAYTYSKTMGVGDNIWGGLFAFDHKYNYGRVSYDRTHVMNTNFVYYTPALGKNGNLLDHKGVRMILNDWEVSGIIGLQSGGPRTFDFNYSTGNNKNLEIAGQNTYGPRPIIAGDWYTSRSDRQRYVQFNTAAIQPAVRPSVGRESGFNYWSDPTRFWATPEVSMMKNFKFSKDGRRYVQFRAETYNLLNHHDWLNRNYTVQFRSPTDLTLWNLPTSEATRLNIRNSQGNIQSGGEFGFGSLSGQANMRTMQLTLRIIF